ncbi:MAG TPA: GNAT family N-acetyltransferase [Blastocatellia bacterium]|nr:GNAT family N-acetyltransferase [Blastocatellia bacterium]
MEITTRLAGPDDAEMLTQLAARTFYDAFALANKPENIQIYMSATFTASRTNEDLADSCSRLLIVEVGGEPGGYAKMYKGAAPKCVTGPNPIEIVRLYVEQKWLGHGVGGALMQACFDRAREEGHRTVYLGVWEMNHRAMAFYRKWGFEVVGSHIFYLGDEAQKDWWMERSL